MKKPTLAEQALAESIRASVRADESHDLARRHAIDEAKSLGLADLLPDNWDERGALKDTAGVWSTLEQRDTANDVFTALEGAIGDLYEESAWYAWVQDWYGSGTDELPYIVIYRAGGELYSAEFEYDDDQKIVIGEPVKVRPVTLYVEREQQTKKIVRRTPSQDLERRKAKAPTKGSVEYRGLPIAGIELRDASDGALDFTGFASMTGVPYPIGDMFTETIERGAFKRPLNNPELDVQLLVNHRGLPLARTTSGTLELREIERGLFAEAPGLDRDDPDVRALEPKMRRGDVTEMSFAFRALDEEWNEDYTHRSLRSVDIHRGDVSIVSYGASSSTTATLRSDEARALIGELERRSGERLPAAFARTLIAELTGAEPEEREADTPFVIPDYTKRARLRLAAIRG
jgi:uncharacterized protein